MRWTLSLAVAIIATASLGTEVQAAPNSSSRLAENSAEAVVDIELALAVDVSYSMDPDELAVQREGYAEAIVSKEFLSALKNGPHGKVAGTSFRGAAATHQNAS